MSSIQPLLPVIISPEFADSFVHGLNGAVTKRFAECRKADFEEIDLVGERPFFELVDAFLARENHTSYSIRQARDRLCCAFWLESEDPKAKLKGLVQLRERLMVDDIGTGLHIDKEIVKKCQSEIGGEMADTVIRAVRAMSALNFLELVFVSHPCAEVVRRSADFLRVMVITERVNEEAINMIWNCYIGKRKERSVVNGPEVKAAVLSLVASLAEYAPYPVHRGCSNSRR